MRSQQLGLKQHNLIHLTFGRRRKLACPVKSRANHELTYHVVQVPSAVCACCANAAESVLRGASHRAHCHLNGTNGEWTSSREP